MNISQRPSMFFLTPEETMSRTTTRTQSPMRRGAEVAISASSRPGKRTKAMSHRTEMGHRNHYFWHLWDHHPFWQVDDFLPYQRLHNVYSRGINQQETVVDVTDVTNKERFGGFVSWPPPPPQGWPTGWPGCPGPSNLVAFPSRIFLCKFTKGWWQRIISILTMGIQHIGAAPCPSVSSNMANWEITHQNWGLLAGKIIKLNGKKSIPRHQRS